MLTKLTAGSHTMATKKSVQIKADVPNAHNVRSVCPYTGTASHTDPHRLAEISWMEDLDIERIHTPDTMSSSRYERKLKEPQTCEWSRRTT
jgi:hypothetical protein